MGKQSGSSLGRCITAPIRVLKSARDLYVNCLTGCASTVEGSGMAPRGKGFRFDQQPCSAAENDIRDLIRAAKRAATVHPNLPKSTSATTIGTIDEDQPCTFESDVVVGSVRSHSSAAAKKKMV